MRDYKRELFESVGKKNGEIMSINAQLKIYQEQADPFIWLPSMENSAYPEHRFIVTDEDIAKMLQDDISKSHNSKKGDDVMGFGNGSAVQATKDSHVEPDSSDVKKGAITSTILPSLEGDLALVNIKANRTALEVAETELLQEKLLYRKRTILNSIQQDVVKFDDIIDKLCLERVLLEADLKFADIKLLVLYKEYVLLKEFEKYDNVLSEKLATKENEKTDIESKIIECQEKANRNKAEIEAIILKEKEIQDDFSRAIGPGNKYESYFVKVFKKKIKRSKKKAKTANNNDDEEESEEDSDIDDYDSNAASQEEEEAYEEKCPGDCDPALWARILDLREMKLDEEERVVEIQKIVDVSVSY